MDRAPLTDPDDPLVGRVLDGRYLIGARIARGGMATVYQALDQRLERTVAVKVMHAGLGDDEEFAARFVREARAAARLSHPHVVGVHDQGQENGTVYLVMEYVPGRTLRDVIRSDAPMTPTRAVTLMEAVVAALAAAHGADLIHRDVKPENVLIADGPEGPNIKVADFGLAKAISADTQHTATGGVLIGTVSYLAPELVVEGRADTRADVYALGVVLFELLTGKRPHEGESPIQVAYKHVHEDVPAPSAITPGIPDYVDALVARATARDRELRAADARVLLRQLRRVRTALLAGTPSDPELVADLLPTKPTIEPAEAGGDDRQDTAQDPFDSGPFDSGPATVSTPPPTRPGDSRGGSARSGLAGAAGVVAAGSASGSNPAGGYHGSAPGGAGAGPTDSDLTSAFDVEHLAHLAKPGAATGPHTTPPPAGSRGASGPGAGGPTATGPLPSPQPGDEGDEATYDEPRRRRWWVWLAAVLVLALVAGFGWWWGVARWSNTPAVLELTQAEAQKEIEDAGLNFELGEPEYSKDVDEGLVVRTDPGPGDRVLDGGTVTVVISLGEELYPIPKVQDLSKDDAQAALTEHFEYEATKEVWSEKVPEGTAIRVEVNGRTVKPGKERPPGTRVTLVVSKGRKPIQVKDFTGKSLERAQAFAEKRNLELDVEEVFDDDVAKGVIVTQSPTDGSLYRGDTIEIEVSKGPHLVEVPSTRAMGVNAATEKLEDLGFEVETRRHRNSLGLGFVYSSDPSPGTMVPKGSTITLILL